MISQANPYDEVPYKSHSIEWTAPERLALASLLHGGPRVSLEDYRVLELGCGDGANLLPLANYRRHATFIGIDGASSQIKKADARKSALELSNIEFIHADFINATQQLTGQFDYIIAHGIFSWVTGDVRDALLKLFAQRLSQSGLLYLNYNTRPGWNVRGMVRDYLLASTDEASNLLNRTYRAQEISAKMALSLTNCEHHYSQLMANEFQFVCDNHVSYIAHEFLAPDNHAYWRSEFMAMAQSHGLEFVADADFNYSSGRIPEDLAPSLTEEQLLGGTPDDTIDLLCYRQLHSPILTQGPFTRSQPDVEEFANLFVASNLIQCASNDTDTEHLMFQHPSGYEVEAREEPIQKALIRLQSLWPRGLRIGEAFTNVGEVMDDLKLLQRNGLIELRCIEPGDFEESSDRLSRLEIQCGGYVTTPYHILEAVPASLIEDSMMSYPLSMASGIQT